MQTPSPYTHIQWQFGTSYQGCELESVLSNIRMLTLHHLDQRELLERGPVVLLVEISSLTQLRYLVGLQMHDLSGRGSSRMVWVCFVGWVRFAGVL
jgi:hypothetical protein